MDASNPKPNSIDTLPMDMLVEIVAKVSENSTKDHCNVKLIGCKRLSDAAEDDFVYKRVSMNSCPVIPKDKKCWSVGEEKFIERCKVNGNKDIAFIEGMHEFVGRKTQESGCDKLRDAALEGKAEAMYVYSMILVSDAEKSRKEEGVEMFQTLKEMKSISGIRETIGKVIRASSWTNNGKQDPPALTPHHHNAALLLCEDTHCKLRTKSIVAAQKGDKWLLDSNDVDIIYNQLQCPRCIASYEFSLFLKMLQCSHTIM